MIFLSRIFDCKKPVKNSIPRLDQNYTEIGMELDDATLQRLRKSLIVQVEGHSCRRSDRCHIR